MNDFPRFSIIICLLVSLVGLGAFGCADGENPHNQDDAQPTDEQINLWEQAADERMSGKADTMGCSGIWVPDQDGFDKRITLTFDDGPNPATTPYILDVLKRWDIKATFFICSVRVNSPEAHAIIQRIVDEGHILANHSHDHPNMTTLSLQDVKEQILRADKILEQYFVTDKFFRFPYAATNCARNDLARSLGYKVSGWHIDTADWCYASSTGGVGTCHQSTFSRVPNAVRGDMVAHTLAQARESDGGIVLLHDIHPYTANNLESIIEALVADGFRFVNIDDYTAYPKLNDYDEDKLSWIGTPCTVDAQCDFLPDAFCHTFGSGVERFGFCSMPCVDECPQMFFEAPSFCTWLDGRYTGSCVATPDPSNNHCAWIPGTSAQMAEQHTSLIIFEVDEKLACLPR